jgi:hypothetical protein
MVETEPAKPDFTALRAEALGHSKAGRYVDAIQTQIRVINDLRAAGAPDEVQDYLRLGGYLFLSRNYSGVLTTLSRAREMFPENLSVMENLGVNLMKLGRFTEAVELLQAVVAIKPDSGNALDGLAHCHGSLGQRQQSKAFGERAMLVKDAQLSDSSYVLPDAPAKPFDYNAPSRNVISFSLFGTDPKYLNGAVRNATLQPDIYPGWCCRFYCDQAVPPASLDALRRLGADIRMMRTVNPFDGLFWRFQVANDPDVDRFLVRDCDAVINIRERVAVDEWLASTAQFHLMRDFYSHTELMLAGMWGGVGNILPPFQQLHDAFSSNKLVTNAIDQWFLRQMVWPIVRQSCLIHDSNFQVFGSRDFPVVGQLPPDKHVGQNEHALAKIDPAGGDKTFKKRSYTFQPMPKPGSDDILSGS